MEKATLLKILADQGTRAKLDRIYEASQSYSPESCEWMTRTSLSGTKSGQRGLTNAEKYVVLHAEYARWMALNEADRRAALAYLSNADEHKKLAKLVREMTIRYVKRVTDAADGAHALPFLLNVEGHLLPSGHPTGPFLPAVPADQSPNNVKNQWNNSRVAFRHACQLHAMIITYHLLVFDQKAKTFNERYKLECFTVPAFGNKSKHMLQLFESTKSAADWLGLLTGRENPMTEFGALPLMVAPPDANYRQFARYHISPYMLSKLDEALRSIGRRGTRTAENQGEAIMQQMGVNTGVAATVGVPSVVASSRDGAAARQQVEERQEAAAVTDLASVLMKLGKSEAGGKERLDLLTNRISTMVTNSSLTPDQKSNCEHLLGELSQLANVADARRLGGQTSSTTTAGGTPQEPSLDDLRARLQRNLASRTSAPTLIASAAAATNIASQAAATGDPTQRGKRPREDEQNVPAADPQDPTKHWAAFHAKYNSSAAQIAKAMRDGTHPPWPAKSGFRKNQWCCAACCSIDKVKRWVNNNLRPKFDPNHPKENKSDE